MAQIQANLASLKGAYGINFGGDWAIESTPSGSPFMG